jgi:DnaJ-class molecular chaperone
MAIVRKLKRITLEHDSRHSEVNCTYSIIQDEEGRLQIDTYGSKYRKIPDKKSQSIRFSPDAIKQLRSILSEEF